MTSIAKRMHFAAALASILAACLPSAVVPSSDTDPLGALQLLHMIILYVPWAAALFSVTSLSWNDWRAILWLSAPVVLLDECLKVPICLQFVCLKAPR